MLILMLEFTILSSCSIFSASSSPCSLYMSSVSIAVTDINKNCTIRQTPSEGLSAIKKSTFRRSFTLRLIFLFLKELTDGKTLQGFNIRDNIFRSSKVINMDRFPGALTEKKHQKLLNILLKPWMLTCN